MPGQAPPATGQPGYPHASPSQQQQPQQQQVRIGFVHHGPGSVFRGPEDSPTLSHILIFSDEILDAIPLWTRKVAYL